MPYRLVALDPKTGRVIAQPRTYQLVRFGIIGPRGGIKPLAKAPVQPYTKTDHAGLNRTISGTRDYVVYEQLLRRHARDAKGKKIPKRDKEGNIIYRRQPSGKKVPVFYQATRITYFRKGARLRPALYSEGKRVRETGIGFQVLEPRQQADQKSKQFRVVTPDRTPPIRYDIKGDSLHQALAGLELKISKDKIFKERKKIAGLFYNIIMYLTLPDKRTIRIPASGALSTIKQFADVFPQLTTKTYRRGKKKLTAFRKGVKTLANVKREIAFTIAQSIKRVGYRFTSAVDLKKYAMQMTSNARKLRAQGKDDRARNVEKARNKMLRTNKNKVYLSRSKRSLYHLSMIIEFETVPIK